MISEAIKTHKRAIIPYVTAGLPSLAATGAIIRALAEVGAAAIEIGIPFSDPMADGPVLQKASKSALSAGFRMEPLFDHLASWSATLGVPRIIMSYINPLMRRGFEATVQRLKESGIAGLIIPDLPSNADGFYELTCSLGLDLIRLVAPTTPMERQSEVVSQCSGFVYAVAVKGVTGARKALPDDIVHQVQTLKSMTDLPVCVGFGISTASQVDNILTFADGVIVGSFLMERIMQAEDPVAAAGDTLLRLSG